MGCPPPPTIDNIKWQSRRRFGHFTVARQPEKYLLYFEVDQDIKGKGNLTLKENLR